jgi:excisionase family DNA binding protein
MKKGLVTISSAAEIIGVSIATLRNWDKSGRLKAIRDHGNHYRFYSISALEHFAKKEGLKRRPQNKINLTP